MKILLVYPQYPDTFWSFKHALKFISKKAAFPPLGLLTVAAMLPKEWEKRVIDMNTNNLLDRDIKWADYVFVSAMAVQKDSARHVISRCQRLGVKTVAGGPLFTTDYEDFDDVDHLVLNEAEVTLQPFLDDLKKGGARHIYTSSDWPEVEKTPIPAWSLIDMKKYSSMSIQYSRGCPYDCEFCDIVILNGHRPRTKNKLQLIEELESIYRRGWRNAVFIVDDNFIGNKKKLKAEILPAIIHWMKMRRYPFSLVTEASINLADDDKLTNLMVDAGFDTVFIGIESPDEESLFECGKTQNRNRDMVSSVKKLQNKGLQVFGGFIVGFDNDHTAIFENQINFIQKSGIVTAMVGLLNAPTGTKLYKRLKSENRLIQNFTGNNTDCSLNFVPRMNHETLISGYKKILNTIYSPKKYYERTKNFLREYRPITKKVYIPQMEYIKAFIRSIWVLGIREKGRRYYWRLLAWTIVKRPRSFPLTITLVIYGFHFRKIVNNYVNVTANSNT